MIEIVFQGLPPTPNTKVHWAVKAKTAKKWRTQARYLALKARPIGHKPFISVELTIVRGSARPCDIDNAIAAAKPLIDGIVDAKIISDDNPNVVKAIRYEWQKTAPKAGYVKIIVDPVSD